MDVILEKYYVDSKYKATTWYLKKNQNAPRPSEHPLGKTKQRQCSTPSSMVLYGNGKTIPFYTTPIGNFIQYCSVGVSLDVLDLDYDTAG